MNVQGINPLILAPLQAQAAATNSTSGTSSSGSSTSGTSSSDLQTMFLNLLVTELQNQDPTQPVDPTEMVGQMISLNQLDQLISINQTLSSLGGSQTPSGSAVPAHNANGVSPSSTLALGRGTAAAQAAGQPELPYGTAFQQYPGYGAVPVTGSLMNLYGNIGAPAASSNHFTSFGGR